MLRNGIAGGRPICMEFCGSVDNRHNLSASIRFWMHREKRTEKTSLSEPCTPGFFFRRFRKNSLKKNSPISKNSLIFAETHGKKDPETEISANFSYLTMIPAIINLRKNEFSLVLLTITTWSLKNSLIKKKLTTFFPKTHQFLLKNSLKIPKTQFLTTFGSKPESKNAQKKSL